MGTTASMHVHVTVIAAAGRPGVSVTAPCAELGISRKSFYEMRRRFDEEGPAGLATLVTVVLAGEGAAAVEQRICRLREELPLDNGAQAAFY